MHECMTEGRRKEGGREEGMEGKDVERRKGGKTERKEEGSEGGRKVFCSLV